MLEKVQENKNNLNKYCTALQQACICRCSAAGVYTSVNLI